MEVVKGIGVRLNSRCRRLRGGSRGRKQFGGHGGRLLAWVHPSRSSTIVDVGGETGPSERRRVKFTGNRRQPSEHAPGHECPGWSHGALVCVVVAPPSGIGEHRSRNSRLGQRKKNGREAHAEPASPGPVSCPRGKEGARLN